MALGSSLFATAVPKRSGPAAGADIRARIARNRARRLSIADAMKLEAGVTGHEVNTENFAGLAYLGTGRIFSPEGSNMMQLYTVAHECGHIFLHDKPPGSRLPSHVMEMEAESYAHQAFREHGMRLPAHFTQWGRSYVGSWIEKDQASGVAIDPRAIAYAAGTRSPYEPLRRAPATWTRFSAAGSVLPGPARRLRALLVRAWHRGMRWLRRRFEPVVRLVAPVATRERPVIAGAWALAALVLRHLLLGACLSLAMLDATSAWLGLGRLLQPHSHQLTGLGWFAVLCGALLWTDLVVALRVALGPLTRGEQRPGPKSEPAVSSG